MFIKLKWIQSTQKQVPHIHTDVIGYTNDYQGRFITF